MPRQVKEGSRLNRPQAEESYNTIHMLRYPSPYLIYQVKRNKAGCITIGVVSTHPPEAVHMRNPGLTRYPVQRGRNVAIIEVYKQFHFSLYMCCCNLHACCPVECAFGTCLQQ